MSYCLEEKCWNCKKKDKCNDRHFINNAIQSIHILNQDQGHLGGGIIRLDCSNIEEVEEQNISNGN
jgi:hypothetical protein